MTPLYGHTSPETAYLVADYPYGRTVRCRIRYWIEHSSRGFRFVSQTEHPHTKRWNTPKPSTYVDFAMCMYLDDIKHVQCARVGQYTSDDDALTFFRNFPGADLDTLRRFAAHKAAFVQACLDGKAHVTLNKVVQPWTDKDRERHLSELPKWLEIAGKAQEP